MASSRGPLSQLVPALGGLAVGVAVGICCERFRRARRLRSERCGGSAVSSSEVVKSGSDVHVDRRELTALVAACLERAGAAAAHAPLVADCLVSADCRGVPSHGVNRAELYCGELKNGLIDGSATPCVATETAGTANVDGRNALGAVVSEFAVKLCIKKAKATGVGLVVCHNSNHFGIAGYWPEYAVKEGLIGFAFTNTSAFMVPTRGVERAGGTNPIACYCPAGEDVFQLDMATTTVPVGKVEVCHRKDQALPLGWAVDRSGTQLTSDPAEVLLHGGLTPLGGMEETAGYKGYGLNMMVEILCAVLSGTATVGPDVLKWNLARGAPVGYGHCFICIDPKQVLPHGNFEQRLGSYLARMRGLQPAIPELSVLVPGDPERAEERTARQAGVRLNEQVALGLRALAREYGCEAKLPASIRDLPANAVVRKHAFASKP
eukprot:TRINITY_DN71424_c0_g1_i1.p1 TRINITY_DN71424_c0_g1~~TRINITY_DN71424_c0_g1_i1.p1  ORF type:complete len:435 (+),score=75.92 TRINITY_DN71424_c0_g1_i1:34-1338(+)